MNRTMILYYLVLSVVIMLYISAWKCGADDDDDHHRISIPILGNVYPDGQYNVTILIGNPPLPYTLDIDTGSDLTWVQCDAPCHNCYPGPHLPYKKLPKFDMVPNSDPICLSLNPGSPDFGDDQCDYQVDYADDSSSIGVLVRDNFNVTLKNGTQITPQLIFGCGYDQVYGQNVSYLVDGVLGLGKGGLGILAQLSNMSVTRSFVGHCFSSAGGGYLFIGAVPILAVWKPILKKREHYFLGEAGIIFDGESSDIRGLNVVFDSGSTYTYLPDPAYGALLDLVQKNIIDLEVTTEDQTLPMCWQYIDHNFTLVSDAATHFKTLALNFTHGNIVKFELPPQSYLIVSDKGNVCFGILNGTGHVGLSEMTVIGDISMQDKLVSYDNENSQVGWVPADCNRLP